MLWFWVCVFLWSWPQGTVSHTLPRGLRVIHENVFFNEIFGVFRHCRVWMAYQKGNQQSMQIHGVLSLEWGGCGPA